LAASHDLVLSTGGTGFGPRDVTPEATRAVLDREAPGLAELMRSAGLAQTPMAALSRAVAGSIGHALVVNLPGSPAGVKEGLDAVLPITGHAVELLTGSNGPHPTGHRPPSSTPSPPAATPAARPGGAQVAATAVKVHGSPPCRIGNALSIVVGGAVHGTLGCAEFDAAAVDMAPEILASGEPQIRTLEHELGQVEVYFEPHEPSPRAIVVSATDVARALRRHLAALGYVVTLVEPRAERLIAGDDPAVASVDDLEVDARTVAILTDHDAPDVTETLASLLRSDVRFIGVMGSRRHVGPYVEDLRAAGFSDRDLGRVRSPLGLDLGGRGAEEIALSIAGGVVADLHGRPGGWLDR
jgi:xanthine/CO dehydrogenase XdhC/CoxF family maturation factor